MPRETLEDYRTLLAPIPFPFLAKEAAPDSGIFNPVSGDKFFSALIGSDDLSPASFASEWLSSTTSFPPSLRWNTHKS